jgi:hypothetical protein
MIASEYHIVFEVLKWLGAPALIAGLIAIVVVVLNRLSDRRE